MTINPADTFVSCAMLKMLCGRYAFCLAYVLFVFVFFIVFFVVVVVFFFY